MSVSHCAKLECFQVIFDFVPSTECRQQKQPAPQKKPGLCWDWGFNEYLDLSSLSFPIRRKDTLCFRVDAHPNVFMCCNSNNFRSNQSSLSVLVCANAHFGFGTETSVDGYFERRGLREESAYSRSDLAFQGRSKPFQDCWTEARGRRPSHLH